MFANSNGSRQRPDVIKINEYAFKILVDSGAAENVIDENCLIYHNFDAVKELQLLHVEVMIFILS